MVSNLKENIPLSDYTTLKTGGVARFMVTVSSVEGLSEATDFAKEKNLPILIVGGGSNLLIPDEGFSGLVIKINLLGLEYADVGEGKIELMCGAGEIFDDVILDTVERGFWGMENLTSIPGTVGATPIQNVGAYGVEIKDLVIKVEAYHLPTNTLKFFSNSECKFGYRDSFFKTDEGKDYVITKVFLALSKNPNPKIDYADLKLGLKDKEVTLTTIRKVVKEIRGKKFPDWSVVGTAGSFFKNPIIPKELGEKLQAQYPGLSTYPVDENNLKIPLGFILDKVCGLKGFREGEVGLYKEQALVLVNYGKATTEDIKKFAEKISIIVEEKTGIKIEPEVRFV